jgi:hypothetical protein
MHQGEKSASYFITGFCVPLVLVGTLYTSFDSMQGSVRPVKPREVLNLNGEWQVEQGTMEEVPREFSQTVIVPGLIDLAEPGFEEVGKQSGLREAFWYRRTFSIGREVPDFAVLKVAKAKYGTKVILNGVVVGEHLPSFTPGYFEVRDLLKPGNERNELLIRVGANRESLPADRLGF